jgi:phage shock protein A
VEHEERLEERVQEIRGDADRADQQGDEMEQRGDELEKKVENVRDEFQRKQRAEDVPGAQEPNPRVDDDDSAADDES